MIAEKAEESIEKAVCYELQQVVKIYGAVYNTPHEGYAVLKEEIEEAELSLKLIKEDLDYIWDRVKLDTLKEPEIRLTEKHAINLAKEAVQCAAVCRRYLETIKREE